MRLFPCSVHSSMNTLLWFCHIVRSTGTLQSQCVVCLEAIKDILYESTSSNVQTTNCGTTPLTSCFILAPVCSAFLSHTPCTLWFWLANVPPAGYRGTLVMTAPLMSSCQDRSRPLACSAVKKWLTCHFCVWWMKPVSSLQPFLSAEADQSLWIRL